MEIKKEHLAEIYTISEDTFSVGMKLYETEDHVLLLVGYVRNRSDGNVLLDCIDISNAKSFETAAIAEHEIALLEFESLDNKLLDYAHQCNS